MIPVSPARKQQRGFALLIVFLLAAAIALMLYRQLPRAAFEHERDKEQSLIDRGDQFRRAIQVFFLTNKRFPSTLEELEKFQDKRFLRRRYIDPMTGKDEWRLVHVNGLGQLTDSLVKKPPVPGNDKDQLAGNTPNPAQPGGTQVATPLPGGQPAFGQPGVGQQGFGQTGFGQTGFGQTGAGQAQAGQQGPGSVNAAVLRRPSDRLLQPGVEVPQPETDPNNQNPAGFGQPGAGQFPQVPGQPGYQENPAQTGGVGQPGFGQQQGFGQPPLGQQSFGQPIDFTSGQNQNPPPFFPQNGVGLTPQFNPQFPGQTQFPGQVPPGVNPTNFGQQYRIDANGQFIPINPQQQGFPQQGFPQQGFAQPGTQTPFPGQFGQVPQPGQNPFGNSQFPQQTPGQFGNPAFPNQSTGQFGNQNQGQFGNQSAFNPNPQAFPNQGFQNQNLPGQNLPGQNFPAQPGPGGAPGPGNSAINIINQLLTTPRQPPPGIATGGANANLTTGGLGIAGVASNSKNPSIKLYKERGKYNEWEFIYELPQPTLPNQQPNRPGGQPTSPTGSPNSPPGSPASAPGSQPASPFGAQPGAQSPFSQPLGNFPQ